MKLIKSILSLIFTFMLFYLMGAFNNASFDISIWSDFSRYCISCLGGFISIIVSILFYFEVKL